MWEFNKDYFYNTNGYGLIVRILGRYYSVGRDKDKDYCISPHISLWLAVSPIYGKRYSYISFRQQSCFITRDVAQFCIRHEIDPQEITEGDWLMFCTEHPELV